MDPVLKRWNGSGFGLMLLGTAWLAACGGGAPAAGGEAGVQPAQPGHAHDVSTPTIPELQMQNLPVDQRLALVSGHAAAGLALYRAGAADEAAHHLTHLGAGAKADEVAGFDALGFKPELFNQISTEIGAGKQAVEIEPLLAEAAVEALRPLQERYEAIRAEAGYLDQVLRRGRERASVVAEASLERVRAAMGFLPAR